ncbi:thioredoxin family protein [Epilithonimonas zeae]|uniref:thioredoxin family protein n=1 Tax=Epilithonimonas zeae TaxID=1416779 RepID=UPI00200C212D|nr:thioredoxin family protein [Epilithonimonas zeae]UQB67862.1 thioredoxin family protein [Epilithonimonas zeae]
MSQKFKELIQSERPVLVDFFATWCQPCKVQSSVLNSVKEQVGEKARIVKIDVAQFPSIAADNGVRGVPTLAIFKNGELLWKESGVHDVNSLVGLLERYSN